MTSSLKPAEVDELQLYYEEPYCLVEGLVITQPKVGQIMKFGEREFYSMLNVFIANTTMYRLQLWEMGIDWNKISNYELFCLLIKTLETKSTKLLFGDIDFQTFKIITIELPDDQGIQMYLYSPIHDITIDEQAYLNMSHYLRTMFGIFPKDEWARGKTTKQAIIWEEQQNFELRKNKPYRSSLLPLISSCVNHPGFKYKKSELKEVGIYEFMDSVHRLQIYESTTALLKGMYSGFVDTSSINKEEFNFMRDLGKTES